MILVYYILSFVIILLSLLPLVKHSHWIFRVWEFARIQLFFLAGIFIVIGLGLSHYSGTMQLITLFSLFCVCIIHGYKLFPYTPLYPARRKESFFSGDDVYHLLSINVYQENHQFEKAVKIIQEYDPDIVLTMETNQAWEEALSVIHADYPYRIAVAQENTYGMHLYAKHPFHSHQVHYFVAEDLPSIEAVFYTTTGQEWTLFGLHPPPPSPTEETTSEERDGELLSVAKKVKNDLEPVLVVGDFNTVAWAPAMVWFRRISGLRDARMGRGFLSTFHARYPLFRFPIDLLYHNAGVVVHRIQTLPNIGSDHLPLYVKFSVKSTDLPKTAPNLSVEEKAEVKEMIQAGREKEGDRGE